MKNRISKSKGKKENLQDLRTFFLACEFKPNSELFSVLDPFAYDIKPAFIHGSLGVISYEPPSYAIIDTEENSPPVFGHILTITHPESVLLLDKIKGAYGPNAYNTHQRRLVHAYTDLNVVHNAWCYVLSEYVLEAYELIEQIELGLWDEDDEDLVQFLERIEGEVDD